MVEQSTEYLDLVTNNDEVIGLISRSQTDLNQVKNFRVINGFLLNRFCKKIWIPTRSPNKQLFPLHWDASVGGHVSSGESYYQAFLRETKEELCLDLSLYPHEEIFYLSPHKNNTSAFMRVFLIYYDHLEVLYNPEDFVSGQWICPEKAIELLNNGQKAKGDLDILLQKLVESNNYKKLTP